MKMIRMFPLVLAFAFPISVIAQWQWIDQDGRKVYSDRAPPPDVPPKNILKQPAGSSRVSAIPGPEVPASTAPAPRPVGKDPVLEARKKQADEEESAKRKSVTDKVAQDRAQNCERARSTMTVLKSGVRMKVPNASGDLEPITDASRATEIDRLQAIVHSDCS